jgi:hypothetical protein
LPNLDLLEQILRNKEHANCEIFFFGDFDVNMLNFESHGLTNDYINGLISKSFTPVILDSLSDHFCKLLKPKVSSGADFISSK